MGAAKLRPSYDSLKASLAAGAERARDQDDSQAHEEEDARQPKRQAEPRQAEAAEHEPDQDGAGEDAVIDEKPPDFRPDRAQDCRPVCCEKKGVRSWRTPRWWTTGCRLLILRTIK